MMIYMGEDKYESKQLFFFVYFMFSKLIKILDEDLIKFAWPEDIWFV